MFNTEKKELKKLKLKIEKNALFDKIFYLKTYQDVRVADMIPIDHYLKYGIKEDRKPNEHFDPVWYRNHYEDVKKDGAYPLEHYVLFGQKENRFTNQNQFLLSKEKEVPETEVTPKVEENINTQKINKEEINQKLYEEAFDEKYYLDNNQDIRNLGINAFEHYNTFGWKEGRNPNHWFDVIYYLNNNLDIKNLGIEPLGHYLSFGKYEGRKAKDIKEEQKPLEYEDLFDFGYSFYGPVLGVFFEYLNTYVKENDVKKLHFLSREGYFLKEIYDTLVKKGKVKQVETEYFLVSRAFLFRLLLKDRKNLALALKSNYKGTLEELLKHRYALNNKEIQEIGFSKEELETIITLPDVDQKTENLLKSKLENHNIKTVEDSYLAYEEYLKQINFINEENPTIVDLGYAGTIQKILSKLFKKDINGVYFMHSNKSEEIKIDDNICKFKASFKSPVKFGEGYALLEKSLVLEGLLTAPFGQLRDMMLINNKIKTIHGVNTVSQKKFQYLQTMINGATEFIIDMNNANVSLCEHQKEIEKVFDVRCSHISNEILELIELDDNISGYNIVSPSVNL